MTKTRNKLKIMGLVLTMVLLIASLGVFSLTASAAEATIIAQGECGAEGSSVQWKYDNTGTLTISGTGAMADYSSSTSDLPWYDYKTEVTTVVVENGVTHVGENCFRGFDNLTTATIADSVETLGKYAFYFASKLESVKLSSNLTTINYRVFYACSSLASITIPPSVTYIDSDVFGECTNLESIEIPYGITEISSGMFSGCSSLTSVKLPDTITRIGSDAFDGCSSLASIILPDDVSYIGSNAFWECSNLAEIKLPKSLEEIGTYTFYSCSSLKSIIIPNSVKEIGALAFLGCSNLSIVHYLGTEEQWASVTIGSSNEKFTDADRHYCTEKAEIAPTCQAAGNESGWYCETCANYIEGGKAIEINPDNHIFVKGFCACGAYEPATLATNENYASLGLNAEYVDYYAISNAGQLFWFAQQVNVEGNREIKGVLTADIDLENRPWTPIGATGEDSNNFRGIFDGQNHTIKGLYVEGGRAGLGFFGEVRTGTVKNFTIYGEVIVNTEVDYVGGVIGSICGVNGETDLERNGAIIQNITSYVNLTAKAHGVGMIGGFVGYANHQSLIENCSWYGTFDAGIYRVDSGAGGFIGKIQENTSEVTIRNCAAYGTIKTNYAGDYNNTATIYMGGFLSFSNTGAKTTLENCLFAGKFERGENLTDQAFLGAFGTLRSVNAIKNCYYLGDDGLEAVHSNSDLKPGSDNVEITSVTKAQLLSGEVAYKLGEHFGQILEGENRQSYPVPGGTKVEDSQRFEIYGQQLNIGGDLSMKYYVMGYAPEFNSKGLYMEFSHNGVKTKVYAGEPNADGFYVFVLEGINPQCMGDSIRAMLYYNETEVTSHGCEDGKEYSVEKNLLNLLEKYKDNAALVALINDTLAYGEAASAYKKHQTMTGNTYTENSSNREIPVSEAQVADVITGYTVRFGTAISIIIEVNPSAFEDTIYKVECNGTELRNFPSPNSPLYKVTNIAATDFDKEWEFVVRSTNPMGDVYGTVVISVNDYLYGISQSSTDEKMVNLANALYNYGVSAKNYQHAKTGVGEHTGGEATCMHGKLCEFCGFEYDATKAPENHASENYPYTDNGDGTHTKTHECGLIVGEPEEHTYDENRKCICGAMLAVVDLTSKGEGSTVDITQDSVIIGDGKKYNISLNIAEDATVIFDVGASGVKLGGQITVADGKTLTLLVAGDAEHTVNGGISLGNGSNVIIEGDLTKENNKLTVTATGGNAGIGANNGVTAGDITIRNARVDATGSGSSDGSGAAIGTSDASMGNILIDNSIVIAAGGYYNSDDFMEISHAAAIGMGYYGGTIGNITLKNSEITASNNGDGLASVIGAGSQNKEGDNNAGTLGDIIITNTDLNLSMVISNKNTYAAIIGPGMGYSYAWTNMGKIIFTDVTQTELDEMIANWLPSDFNEWGAYALGRGYDGSAYKKETFGGVWVSDGNGGTVQIGSEDGYYCINDAID